MSQKLDFTEVKDEAFILKLLSAADRHKVPFILWFKDQSLKFETITFSFIPGGKQWSLVFPDSIDKQAFENARKAEKANGILGSCHIDGINFFFKTTCHPLDHSVLPLVVPKTIFKLQRRAHMRIPFAKELAPRLTMMDPSKEFSADKPVRSADILSFRILDISAGGVAIAIPAESKPKFPNGASLKDIRFKIKQTEIATDGIVRYSRPLPESQGKSLFKVAIQMVALKPHYERQIAQFALNESLRMFSLLDS